MNLRIDYQPLPPTERDRRIGPRRRGRVLAAALGSGVLLLVAALQFVPRHSESRPDDDAPADSAPATLAPATAMPRGEATAAALLADRSVSGLPRGFPRSEAGAVEAGASFASSVFVVQRIASGDRSAYMRDAMLEPPSTAELDAAAADFRTRHRLTPDGRLLDENGKASTSTRFTSQCHPALGAYRVESFTAHRAAVDYWMPCLLGTVDNRETAVDVRTQWQMGRMTLHWHAGDWRVGELARGPFKVPVTPDDAGEPATTLDERAALLGTGWEAFADASEERPAEAPGQGR